MDSSVDCLPLPRPPLLAAVTVVRCVLTACVARPRPLPRPRPVPVGGGMEAAAAAAAAGAVGRWKAVGWISALNRSSPSSSCWPRPAAGPAPTESCVDKTR